MQTQFSPEIQALQQRNAEQLVTGIKERIEEMAPMELWRWLSTEMYEGTRQVARAARLEQENNA